MMNESQNYGSINTSSDDNTSKIQKEAFQHHKPKIFHSLEDGQDNNSEQQCLIQPR